MRRAAYEPASKWKLARLWEKITRKAPLPLCSHGAVQPPRGRVAVLTGGCVQEAKTDPIPSVTMKIWRAPNEHRPQGYWEDGPEVTAAIARDSGA